MVFENLACGGFCQIRRDSQIWAQSSREVKRRTQLAPCEAGPRSVFRALARHILRRVRFAPRFSFWPCRWTWGILICMPCIPHTVPWHLPCHRMQRHHPPIGPLMPNATHWPVHASGPFPHQWRGRMDTSHPQRFCGRHRCCYTFLPHLPNHRAKHSSRTLYLAFVGNNFWASG